MRRVTFPTFSPHVLRDALNPSVRRRTIEGVGLLWEPAGPSAPKRLPAVVIAEGLGGLKTGREIAYGEQLARWGYAALAVDTFETRGAAGYPDDKRARVVTEAMMLADVFAGLRFLADHPRVDPGRVAVMGFSYGAMVSVFAAYRSIKRVFAGDGPGFAAHVGYYGCTVARFADPATTGAPLLILQGELDENLSIRRSREIADDLRRGGSEVEHTIYPETWHQWDGEDETLRHVRFSLAPLHLTVGEDLRIRDAWTRLEMRGPVSRRAIIAANVSWRGYGILRNPEVKVRSDAALAGFLARSIGEPQRLLRGAGPAAHRAAGG